MKYLVMEKQRSYVVLLDENGEFRYAANLNYDIGETITDPVLMEEPPKQKTKVIPFPVKATAITTVVAAIAAIAFIFIRGGQQAPAEPTLPPTVATSVYVSINPEVRMDIDENGEIIELAGINAEGRELVAEATKDATRQEALTELVKASVNKNYLEAGGLVKVGIDTDSAHYKQYSKEFEETLETLKQEEVDFTYEIVDIRNPQPKEEPKAEEPVEDDDDVEETAPVQETAPAPKQQPKSMPAPSPKPKSTPAPAPAPPVDDDDDDDDWDDDDWDDDSDDDTDDSDDDWDVDSI